MRSAVVLAISLILAGCRSPAPTPLPTYPRVSAAESLDILAARSASLRDVTGRGRLTFEGRDGRSVRLETAYVLAPPDRARVRAWKFGRAVFDLTRRDGELFLFLPRGDDRAAELTRSAATFGDAVGEWLRLLSGDLAGPGATATLDGGRLVVRRPMEGGLTLRATIDRDTLTPRRYEAVDSAGKTRFVLTLSGYRPLAGGVWPTVVEARGPDGFVRVEATDLEADVAPAAAFDPPRRARRIPDEP